MYVCTYACSCTFFSLAMPTTDYCVDQICGRMLVRGFTYLPFFVVHIHHNYDGHNNHVVPLMGFANQQNK